MAALKCNHSAEKIIHLSAENNHLLTEKIKCLRTCGENEQCLAHTVLSVITLAVSLCLFAVWLVSTLRLFPLASSFAVRSPS